MKVPRVMIAAPASGSGKTQFTCGLLSALGKRQIPAASFKCGPDYIDPLFQSRVLGVPARNLDSFFCEENTVRFLLGRQAGSVRISVLEGVMGYYDGLGGTGLSASSYDLARITDTPVILLVDARGMSRSVIPLIQGMRDYRPDSRIRGVIFNRMSAGLYDRLRNSVEEECGLPVLGYLPNLPETAVPSRRLGLVLPEEVPGWKEKLAEVTEQLEETVDIGGIVRTADAAPELSWREPDFRRLPSPVRIGVAQDEAFCFCYEDNLDLLQRTGLTIVPFSPLRDAALPPDIGGVIFPGGYPELYAADLSANTSMRRSVSEALASGLPCLAECGGFLYLHREFTDLEGRAFPGVGWVRAKACSTGKRGPFGYVELTAEKDGLLGPAGIKIRGHEYHYFASTDGGMNFRAEKPAGRTGWHCIHTTPTSAVGFPHLYYYSSPEAVWNFAEACARARKLHG